MSKTENVKGQYRKRTGKNERTIDNYDLHRMPKEPSVRPWDVQKLL
jgi:hypothetical protein